MSRIDKLVTNAFPDELRNVEPAEVDEDAILDLTLAKLGLEQPAVPPADQRAGEKKRIIFDADGGKREEVLVEIPVERVKRPWVRWAAGAAAACLALACLFWWAPLLLSTMGFGTRAHSTGELEGQPSDGAVFGTVSSAAPSANEDKDGALRALEGNGGDIEVLPNFTAEGNGLNVSLRFHNVSTSYYSVKAVYEGKELYCITRRVGDNAETLSLTFLSEETFNPNGHIDLFVELIPALAFSQSDLSIGYLTAAGFTLSLYSGSVSNFSQEEYELWGYTVSDSYTEP